MTVRFPGAEAEAIEREFAGVNLGDRRLDDRLLEVVRLMAELPRESFSGMCEDEAEREALYRLLRNSRIESEDIIRPHMEGTLERARAAERVLVVHDTTEVQISADAELKSFINRGKRGFRLHASLAVRSDDGAPLGVCGLEVILRKSDKSKTKRPNGQRMRGDDTAKLENKESDRWLRAITETEHRLTGGKTVHVMDREADSYALLAAMVANNVDFVVRLAHKSRRAKSRKNEEFSSIERVLVDAKRFKRTREVQVSKRKAKRAPSSSKRFETRRARRAELELSWAKVTIPKPRYLGTEYPNEITLHVVRASEQSPPKGVTPIEWTLLTPIAVETKAGVEMIIDIYRKRWIIEEYFRALKSGCALEKRRLINACSIMNSLMTFVPIAWRSLWLRQRARQDSQAPATEIFSAAEIAILRTKGRGARRKLPQRLPVGEALALVAESGGHRKRDGDPGWQTLMRGLNKLALRAEGWELAQLMAK